MRSATADEALRLTPPLQLSLEECIEFLAEDELLEVTPKSLRLRKKILDHEMRKKMEARAKKKKRSLFIDGSFSFLVFHCGIILA